METEEQQFINGFNGGYLIAKHEPELSNKILENLQPVNEYTHGPVQGKNEWLKEKELAQLQELNNLRTSSYERDNPLERGNEE